MTFHASPSPSVPGRRERRKADTRRRLLVAARLLFVEKGYDATRPQDIAQAVHVAAGPFYVHFAHKRDVLLAFTEDVSDELAARFGERVSAAKDFSSMLDRALEALCDYSDANPGVLSTVFADDAVYAAELPRGTSLRGLDRRNVLDDLDRFPIRALLARTPHAPDEEDS